MTLWQATETFPILARTIGVYDSSLGFSYALADRFLLGILAEPQKLVRAKAELDEALKNPETPWPALLVNDSYEAADELEPAAAKEQVLNLLWDALYPELPPRLPNSYHVIELSEGGDARIVVERASDDVEVARVLRIARQGETLVVDYELIDTGLLPAVLRKHLRDGMCTLLAGSAMLESARKIECVNIKQGTRAVLPFSCPQ